MFFVFPLLLFGANMVVVGSTLNISGSGDVTAEEVNAKQVASIQSVIINEGILGIKAGAFAKCYQMTSIKLPNSLIYMEGCFKNTQLKAIHIPAGLERIDMLEMWDSTPLESVTCDTSNKFFSAWGNCLLNKNETYLYGFVNKGYYEFPQTITTIGPRAFAYKDEQTFKIPDSVQHLSTRSFLDSYLIKVEFSQNSQLLEIPEYAFHQSVSGNFYVPKKVTKIQGYAFYGSSISQFLFYPNSNLQNIGNSAFNVCPNLDIVNFPKSVTTISESVFEGAAALREVTIEPGCTSYYMDDKGIWSHNKTQLVWVHHTVKELEIANNVTKIGLSILQTCENLSSLKIIDGGKYSEHYGVIYTNSFTVASAVIGGITNCMIHKSCKTIKASLFKNLKKITNITFPAGCDCTYIGNYAFASCPKLTHIQFSEGIQNIDYCAFRASGLVSLEFPKSLNSIGTYNIRCYDLESVKFHPDCNLTRLYVNVFAECTKLHTIQLPNKLVSIDGYAFNSCNLTSLTIPASVENLNDYCFANNTHLSTITFTGEPKLKTINSFAFSQASITKIEIPSEVSTLATQSFSSCGKLSEVKFLGTALKELVAQVFMNCTSIKSITLPSSLTKIEPTAFYQCTKLTAFHIKDSSTFEEEDGTIYKKSPKVLALFPPGKKSAVIADLTSGIVDNAFYGCSELINLSFGNSEVTSIGELSFYQCIKLSGLYIPKTVETIRQRAFEGCSAMTVIEFAPESHLRSIGQSTFLGCGSLTKVSFPADADLQAIEDGTFSGCVSLSSFTFPYKLSSIGSDAFKDCRSLKEINLSATSIDSIASNCFSGCSLVSKLSLPARLNSIEAGAFQGCSSLRSILLNATSVTSIGDNAFFGCKGCVKLVLPSGLQSIGGFSFVSLSITEVSIPDNASLGMSCFANCLNLMRIYYCGEKDCSDATVFENINDGAIAYTMDTYGYNTFGGIDTAKVMRRCGLLPTNEFTISNFGHGQCFSIVNLIFGGDE